MKMNYAEFTAEYQRRFKSVNFGFVHGCIKEALGIDKPMIAIYTEKDLLEVHDAAVIRKYEAEKHEKRPETVNRILPGLAQKGLWFRASSYHVVDGWIEATPEATIEQYPLSEVLKDLTPAMAALGEDVVFTQDEDGNLELSPKEHKRFCKFYARFGPLGLGFRNAWEIVTWPLGHKAEVTVDPLRDERIEILEHFGANLKPGKYLVKKPLSEVIPVSPGRPRAKASVLDFDALYRGYREQGFEAAFAVVHFSLAARRLARRIEDPSCLEELEEAFMHSRPRLSMDGGGLSVAWEPNALIDAAYINLFEVSTAKGYKVCADPKCGHLFESSGKTKYCSKRCQQRHAQERHRPR